MLIKYLDYMNTEPMRCMHVYMQTKYKPINVKTKRANFGVQQLPLFNCLKPEGKIGGFLSRWKKIKYLK